MARPRVPLISPAKVAAAALAIIDEDGFDKLTVSRLAADMGVNHASLYHHFRHKGEIVDSVIRYILPDVVEPVDGEDVVEWMVRNALTYRKMLIKHPSMAPLMARRPHRSTMPVYDRILQGLVALGLGEEDAEYVIEATEALIIGYASIVAEQAKNVQDGATLSRFELSYRSLLTALVEQLRKPAKLRAL